MSFNLLKRFKLCWNVFLNPDPPKTEDSFRPVHVVQRTIEMIPVCAVFRVQREMHVPEEYIKRQLCHSLAEFIMKNIPLDVKAELAPYETVYSVRLRIVPEHNL